MTAEIQTSVSNSLQRAGIFFKRESPIHQAADRLVKTLHDLELPFAIAGAMAVNAYGHERLTEDLNILMEPDDLKTFKEAKIGLGWVNKFEGSKGVRDAVAGVAIDVLLTGDYPGDGLEKPVRFPSPVEAFNTDPRGLAGLETSSPH